MGRRLHRLVAPALALAAVAAAGSGVDYASAARGATGADGKSAYEIAVEAGHPHSEEEWAASLKGDTGETGAQGPQGSRARPPAG